MRKKKAEALALKERRAQALQIKTPLEEQSERMLEISLQTKQQMPPLYERLAQEAVTEEVDDDVLGRIESYKRTSGNLIKAYQHTTLMGEELGARWNDLKKSRKRKRLIGAAPANSVIDLEEVEANHFARGTNLYKLLLICFIGSFVGVIIELGWCLVTNGYLQSRSGLVYGPFNLLYGVGAVALTFALYRFRNHSSWISFAGGFIVGSAVEYICSWGQEVIFGSRSWDYHDMAFNLNGRICLLYSICWGILGVLWVKNIYPRIAAIILKVPNRVGKIITWALLAFFLFDAAMTGVTTIRWSQRMNGAGPADGFWGWIDERFPDERMQRIFANTTHVNTAETSTPQ